MKSTKKARRKLLIVLGVGATGILAAVILILILTNGPGTAHQAEKHLFYHALRFNGEFVSDGVYLTEWRTFYVRNRTNAKTMKMTEEERYDLFIEQVIDRMVLEDYMEKKAGGKITQEDVTMYINQQVKPRFPNEDDFTGYLAENGLGTEKDLEREVRFYLLRLACLPAIAREKGITLDENDRKKLTGGQTTEDVLLMEKFLKSEEEKEWVREIRKDVTIEILSPAVMAFRNYREGNYREAATLYREAYERYGKADFLKKAKECEEKLK